MKFKNIFGKQFLLIIKHFGHFEDKKERKIFIFNDLLLIIRKPDYDSN
jgi:hypothetical protein